MRLREKKKEKAFNSRIEDLEDNVFEVGALEDASSFMKELKNIVDYIQLEDDHMSDVVEAMRDIKDMTIIVPNVPREWLAQDGTTMIKPSESDIFVFKCEYKEAKAKEKTAKRQKGRHASWFMGNAHQA